MVVEVLDTVQLGGEDVVLVYRVRARADVVGRIGLAW